MALKIMMPDDSFKTQVELMKGNVAQIADKFGVPTYAVRMKAKSLGLDILFGR